MANTNTTQLDLNTISEAQMLEIAQQLNAIEPGAGQQASHALMNQASDILGAGAIDGVILMVVVATLFLVGGLSVYTRSKLSFSSKSSRSQA